MLENDGIKGFQNHGNWYEAKSWQGRQFTYGSLTVVYLTGILSLTMSNKAKNSAGFLRSS